MIEVKNLVKSYDGHMAVDHLTFTVEDGQIYGFLGPNGAGKSTTMNIITGYIGATEGEVTVNGYDILAEPEKAKQCIGYLPELPPLYMDMTVEEYLLFAADIKKLPNTDKKAAVGEALQTVMLEDVKHRLIKNLSKGYRQRVGLAQALLGKPPVIILDEPTVGLDPKQIIEIRDLIKNLKKDHTVLLSSHILSEVNAVCDQILIVAHGRLIACDTPLNLERQMATARQMELEIKGENDSVQSALATVAGLEDISVTPKEGGSCLVSLRHSGSKDTDVRETIFWAMADNRLPILSMTTAKASLEEVFLELTREEPSLGDSPSEEMKQQEERSEEEDIKHDGNL